VRRHREQVAEEARHKVTEEDPDEDACSVASDPHAESDGLPTGEKQAAVNRNEDPPA
jgi:hypothetical protein